MPLDRVDGGADGFVVKPVDTLAFVAQVRRALPST